jgi:hypothetical protein
MNKQLTLYLNINNLIEENQYGFRPKHSCILQLLKLIDKIYQNLTNKNIMILTFIDLKQAFPSVNHDILIKDLYKIGIQNNELNWFKTYLENMTHYTYINNMKSDTMKFKNGVYQGSI